MIFVAATFRGSALTASCWTAILGAFLAKRHKTDGSLGRIGRRHQFAQSIKNLLDLGPRVAAKRVVCQGQRVGLAFQLVEAFGQVGVEHDAPPAQRQDAAADQ
jgi:hypothetical protein